MTKSELIDLLANRQKHLAHLDVELSVKSIIEQAVNKQALPGAAQPQGRYRV